MSSYSIKKGIVKGDKIVASCKYDEIKPMVIDGKESDNVFEVIQDGALGIIGITDDDPKLNHKIIGLHKIHFVTKNYVIASIYDERHGEKYGLLRLPYLTEIKSFMFDSAEDLGNELIKVKRNGLYGIVHSSGKVLIDWSFSQIEYDNKMGTFIAKL